MINTMTEEQPNWHHPLLYTKADVFPATSSNLNEKKGVDNTSDRLVNLIHTNWETMED